MDRYVIDWCTNIYFLVSLYAENILHCQNALIKLGLNFFDYLGYVNGNCIPW